MISIREYVCEDGTNPFRIWFDKLDAQAAAKIATAVMRMEMGAMANIKWFDGIGEYRIDWGPGYRIYVVKDGASLIVLLGGGTKQRQQIDIDSAKSLYIEYKKRKKMARSRR